MAVDELRREEEHLDVRRPDVRHDLPDGVAAGLVYLAVRVRPTEFDPGRGFRLALGVAFLATVVAGGIRSAQSVLNWPG